MAWPGRSSFPGKIADQQLPLGTCHVLRDHTVETTRMTMSPAQSQKTRFCCLCLCLQRRQVLPFLGEGDQSQPDPQQSSLPDTWPCLEQFVTFKDTTSAFHPNNYDRYQKTNGERGPESLILASIFFLCFLVLGWPRQVDKLLKKGKYHFNLFL